MKSPARSTVHKDPSSDNTTAPPPRFSGLAREIVAILVIKVAVLSTIWVAWFSAPPAQHMQMLPERVSNHLIQTPILQPSHSPLSSTSGSQDHATR